MALQFQQPNVGVPPSKYEALNQTLGKSIAGLPAQLMDYQLRKKQNEIALLQLEQTKQKLLSDMEQFNRTQVGVEKTKLFEEGTGLPAPVQQPPIGMTSPLNLAPTGQSGVLNQQPFEAAGSTLTPSLTPETEDERRARVGFKVWQQEQIGQRATTPRGGWLYVNPKNPEDISLTPVEGWTQVSSQAVNAFTGMGSMQIRRNAPAQRAAQSILNMLGKKMDENGEFDNDEMAQMYIDVQRYLNPAIQLTAEEETGLAAKILGWAGKQPSSSIKPQSMAGEEEEPGLLERGIAGAKSIGRGIGDFFKKKPKLSPVDQFKKKKGLL